LQQENFESSTGGSWQSSSFADEYEGRTVLLPEHPYNLELYVLRQRPLLRGMLTAERIVTTERGAVFRYRKNPAFLELDAIDSSTTGRTPLDTRTYRATGSYLLGPLANSAGYSETDASAALSMRTLTRKSFVNNDLRLDAFTFHNSINQERQRQESVLAAPVDLQSFTSSQVLSSNLPWNFSGALSHDYRSDTAETVNSSSSADAGAFDESNKSKTRGIFIAHQLYDSLRTSYGASRMTYRSRGGDGESEAQSLRGNYTKKIPTGSLLASVHLQRLLTVRTGAPAIIREIHPSPVPGVFNLNQQAIDQGSIRVMVKDPAAPALVLLQPGADYQLSGAGNTVQVSVVNVPFVIDPAASYEFEVTYSLVPNALEMETRGKGLNLNVSLFDTLFNPYYSFSTSRQDLIAGTLPGGPDATETETCGFILQKSPYSFLAEYSDIDSRLTPLSTWKTMLDYRYRTSATADVSARLSFTRTSHHDTAAAQASGFTEETSVMNVTFHKTLPRKNLNLSVGGAYVQRRVFTTASNYSLNGNFIWTIGKLDVSGGAATSYGTSGTMIGKQTVERGYAYLTVSRKLF
jgi:hypothetical protein